MKTRSVQNYRMSENHREALIKRSIAKYAMDDIHKQKVKKASLTKYQQNEQFRETIRDARCVRYKNDEVFRTKLKESSKQKYHSNYGVKRTKMENTKKRRSLKKIKLENEEEVINLFRRNTAQGPDYVCCCCHRLLFVNQVQPCDRNTYAIAKKLPVYQMFALKMHFCTSAQLFVQKIVQDRIYGYVLHVIAK